MIQFNFYKNAENYNEIPNHSYANWAILPFTNIFGCVFFSLTFMIFFYTPININRISYQISEMSESIRLANHHR